MPILANIGVPMIVIYWPLMVSALVPVILVEAMLIRRWVSLSTRDAFIGIAKANVFSTLVGVPLAWLAMFALEFVVMLPAGLAAEKWKWEFERDTASQRPGAHPSPRRALPGFPWGRMAPPPTERPPLSPRGAA